MVQETFTSAYKHIGEFDNANIKAWLSTIATNKCRDYFRSKSYKTSMVSDNIEYDIQSCDDVEDEYEAKELETTIHRLINNLSEPYKSAALAHYIEGTALKDYAKKNKINIKTAYTHITRAKEKLKNELRKEYGDGFI